MEQRTYRFYNRKDYHRVKNLTLGDRCLSSCYNHNYYVNETTGDVILEECDDDGFFDYFRINQDRTETYLGGIHCVNGIFGDGNLLPSDVSVEEDGSVELPIYW